MELSSFAGDSVGLHRRAAGCFRYVVRITGRNFTEIPKDRTRGDRSPFDFGALHH